MMMMMMMMRRLSLVVWITTTTVVPSATAWMEHKMLSSYKAALMWQHQSSSSSSTTRPRPPLPDYPNYKKNSNNNSNSNNNNKMNPLIMTTSLEHDVDHSISRHERVRQNPFYCPPIPGADDDDDEDEDDTESDHENRKHQVDSTTQPEPTSRASVTTTAAQAAEPTAHNSRRERHSLFLGKGKEATIVSRTVPIPGFGAPQDHLPLTDSWNIVVWEWEKPSAIIEAYWQVEHYGLAFVGKQQSSSQSLSSSSSSSGLLDPFGLVAWPGAVVAAQELQHAERWIRNQRVLVLGSGVGVEVQVAAQLGAAAVLATDLHPTTLQLLQYGAEQAGCASQISTQLLDIAATSTMPLPTVKRPKQTTLRIPTTTHHKDDNRAESNTTTTTTATTGNQQDDDAMMEEMEEEDGFDVMIVADVLYNEKLAWHVIQRIVEARERNPRVKILVSDSQRFVTDFPTMLQEQLDLHYQTQVERLQQQQTNNKNKNGNTTATSSLPVPPPPPRVEWTPRWLPRFTGSGVLLDTDQTYEVKARTMWITNTPYSTTTSSRSRNSSNHPTTKKKNL